MKTHNYGGSPHKKIIQVSKENFYLKTEFIAYLQSKNLAISTIESLCMEVSLFFGWIKKEEIQVTKADIFKRLEYLKNERNLQNTTRSIRLLSMNHYYTFLVQKEEVSTNPCAFIKIRGTHKKSLHRIYTSEELTELYDTFYLLFVKDYDVSYLPKNQQQKTALSKERNAVIVNILIHQGVRTSEINTLELNDLDVMNATLKIRGASKGKERILSLEGTQIGVLINYLQHIRPQLLAYQNTQSEQLFVTLPTFSKQKNKATTSLMNIFKPLLKQLKTIDENFLSMEQIRTSVITHWLKVHGLRKTQVMAGHRQISTTEKYKANDLQQLTDDISKLHPF